MSEFSSHSMPPILYQDILAQSEWLSEQSAANAAIPRQWRPWLFDHGSLTAQLKAHSNDAFAVRVLSESWGVPDDREMLKLKLALNSVAQIRQVELLCNGEVMVFARSIIPQSLFEAQQQTFKELGSKPLGHLLFKKGGEQQSRRDISIYRPEAGPTIYGRSTPYLYEGAEILVSEFFVNQKLATSD